MDPKDDILAAVRTNGDIHLILGGQFKHQQNTCLVLTEDEARALTYKLMDTLNRKERFDAR